MLRAFLLLGCISLLLQQPLLQPSYQLLSCSQALCQALLLVPLRLRRGCQLLSRSQLLCHALPLGLLRLKRSCLLLQLLRQESLLCTQLSSALLSGSMLTLCPRHCIPLLVSCSLRLLQPLRQLFVVCLQPVELLLQLLPDLHCCLQPMLLVQDLLLQRTALLPAACRLPLQTGHLLSQMLDLAP